MDVASGRIAPIGRPAIIESALIAPDGRHLLVTRVHRPSSYLYAVREFPNEVEAWDLNGAVQHKVASLPLQDKVRLTA